MDTIKVVDMGNASADLNGTCWPCAPKEVAARYFLQLKDKGFNVCETCKNALLGALQCPAER